MPLSEDVEAYFKREVLPHAPDAWIDQEKTKIGYEIPFNRHFYVFEPPRPLAEIDADLQQVTDRIKAMIEETGGMSFGPYEHYKESGIQWLGAVPKHWDVSRIKYTSYLKGRVGWKGLTSDEYLNDGYSYLVTGTDFGSKVINWRECYCVDKARYEDDPFIQLRNGDLLITKDGTIGKLALVSGLDRPACLNSGIFLVRPLHSYLTEYLFWVLSSRSFVLVR